MNSVQLIGNLTRNPERKTLESGTVVANLRLAVNGRRKNKDTGEWEEAPNFFTVLAYGKLAELCAEHLESGRKVAVTGRLDYREWDGDHGKASTVEIVASDVDFLSSRPAGDPVQAAEREPALV